jgi:signal transduction histidine kinase
MADPSTSQAESNASARRPSFRRRLLVTLGPAFAAALGALALIAWGAAYVAVHQNALEVLAAEVEEMRADVPRRDTLDLSGYAWDEAHHRLAVARVDPIFVQVFTPDGRLVRQSANVASLPSDYPRRLLASPPPSGVVPSLQTFTASERTFYYQSKPLEGADGRANGIVQVAREVPEHRAMLWQFGGALAGLWVVLSIGLLGLVAWAAGRVLRPLRRMTQVARSVNSADLDVRVDVPADADRETATLAYTLNSLLDRIEEHVETLRTFTANAAHELQTPLTVLRGHVEIALRREREADSYRETLRLLDRKLGGLVRTLRALLTLTRLDRTGNLEREPVQVGALAADEAESFRARAEAKGVLLTVDTEAETWGRAQPDLLREAVRNLIDNAVKYTSAGHVTVSVERDGDQVVIGCEDTGRGMSEAECADATSRFYRGADAGQVADGSGLGLALVKRIVEEHEGQLTLHSTPGEGTRVTVTVPAVSPPEGARRASEGTPTENVEPSTAA